MLSALSDPNLVPHGGLGYLELEPAARPGIWPWITRQAVVVRAGLPYFSLYSIPKREKYSK
jgi:hypothetical protein